MTSSLAISPDGLQNVAEFYQAKNLGTLLPAGGHQGCLFSFYSKGPAWLLELGRSCVTAQRYLYAGGYHDRFFSFCYPPPTALLVLEKSLCGPYWSLQYPQKALIPILNIDIIIVIISALAHG